MADAPHSVFEAGSSDNSRQLLSLPLCKDGPLIECLKLQNKNKLHPPPKQRIKGKSSWPFASYSAFSSAQKSQLHTVEIRCLWYIHHQFFSLYSKMNASCRAFPSNHSWKREKGSLEAPAISSWYLSHCHQNSNSVIPQVTSPHRFEFTNCSTSLKYIPHKTGMPLCSSPAWSRPSLLWCTVKDSFPQS